MSSSINPSEVKEMLKASIARLRILKAEINEYRQNPCETVCILQIQYQYEFELKEYRKLVSFLKSL